ncbi:MAG TPA: ABC transporter permease subunit [Thermomicrobiales bacterium]|nr:ABC transporter permease subunit [Thermomicrobiales bacterium]
MIEDISTVLWKELKEFTSQGGRGRMAKITMIMAFVPALLLPLQFGRAWIESPLALTTLMLAPFIVLTIIADAIAGERERHTLETLLASRLSDRAILYGKIGAATLYVMAQLTMFTLPSLVIINLFFGRDGLLIYPASVWIGVFLVGPLVAILTSSVGVLVSMRARTVRQAQMTLMTIMLLAFLLVPIILAVIAIGALLALSAVVSADTLNGLFEFGRQSGILAGVLAALSILLVVDLALVSIVENRFHRSRLVVD